MDGWQSSIVEKLRDSISSTVPKYPNAESKIIGLNESEVYVILKLIDELIKANSPKMKICPIKDED